MNSETEKEIQCLRNAEQYCRERAAMSWSDRQRDHWHRMAEWNRARREEREQSQPQ